MLWISNNTLHEKVSLREQAERYLHYIGEATTTSTTTDSSMTAIISCTTDMVLPATTPRLYDILFAINRLGNVLKCCHIHGY